MWLGSEAMSDDPDFEYLVIDSTIIRAHQHAAGYRCGQIEPASQTEDEGMTAPVRYFDPAI
jgi:hypothetical protein